MKLRCHPSARAGLPATVLVTILVLAGCSQLDLPSVTAERGEFLIDIQTTGEIKAVDSRAVSKPRRGWSRAQIVQLAPEGNVVEEGGFLIQFDTAEAERNLEERRNQLKDAQAALATERASAASRRAELESQLKNQEYSHEQARIRFEQMKYEAEIRRREQELELRKAELSLEEAREKIEGQKIIDEANLQKAEIQVRQAQIEVQRFEETLKALTVTAPIGGLVVYKEIWSQGGGRAKVKVGDTPWPGMELIEIPDLSRMKVNTKVNEVDIHRVKVGQGVQVTVDALPDTTFMGSVTSVATLAKREGKSDVKSFDVEVHLEGTHPRLRPGMTASCQIVTGRLDDVVFIPLDAVFEREGETVCYVLQGEARSRRIELGKRNADFIVVTSGLEEGESVSLRDPNQPLEDIGGEPPRSEASL